MPIFVQTNKVLPMKTNLNFYYRIIYLFIMWGLFSSFSYQSSWEEVEKAQDSKPKTALDLVGKIEAEAKKEKNYPQQIRCLITRANIRKRFEDNSFIDCLKEVENFSKSAKDPVAKQLSSFLLGTLYYNYYINNSYKIDRRTELIDSIPEDIKEWTTNIFVNKVRSLHLPSLTFDAFKSVPSSEYTPILQQNSESNSNIYAPTLYDFLLNDLGNNYSDKFYTQAEKEDFLLRLIEMHKDDKDRSAYTNAKLKWLRIHYPSPSHRDEYINQLMSLKKELNGEPATVIVVAPLCEELKARDMEQENPNSDIPQTIVDLCNETIEKHPKHHYIGVIKNFLDEVERASINISMENARPNKGEKIALKIRYANTTSLKLSLYKYTLTPEEWLLKDYKERQTANSKIGSYEYTLAKSNYYIPLDTVVEIPAQNYGSYFIRLENDKQQRAEFSVTDLFYLQKQNRNLKDEYIIVDAKDGSPKKEVTLYAKKYKHYESLETPIYGKTKSDKDGCAVLDVKQNGRYAIFMEDGADKYQYIASAHIYKNNEKYVSDNESAQLSIFTDRSIYRPQQIVHFKAIAYQLGKGISQVLPNEKVKIVLRDANYQVIGEQELTSNEFGSISSSFTLPSNSLSGRYSLECVSNSKYGSCSFSVEEYKRPTFEVKMTQPTSSFSFGDTIEIKGEANYLLGTPLSEGKVEYRIERKGLWFCWWQPSFNITIATGETSLSKDGSFTIPFTPQKEETTEKRYYNFIVHAKVTDTNGETHEQEIYLPVGDNSMMFIHPNKDRCTIEDLSKETFSILNLSGKGQECKIAYSIRLNEVSIASGETKSNEDGKFFIQEETTNWTSGKYCITLKTTDEKQREIKDEFSIILYRTNDQKPPVESPLWIENFNDASLSWNEAYKVRIGTSFSNAHMLLIIDNEHGEVEKRWVDLSNEIKPFEFKLTKEDGDAKMIRCFLVYNNKCHEKSFTIRLKEESKEWPVQLSVFRDKMQPGSKEAWTLTLPKGKDTEVLASMYDASLDQIKSHYWNFSPLYHRYVSFPYWNRCFIPSAGIYYEGVYKFNNYSGIQYDHWMPLPSENREELLFVTKAMVMEESASLDMALQGSVSGIKAQTLNSGSVKQARAAGKMMATDNAIESESEGADSFEGIGDVQLRSNFAETAFFYPHLTTNENGEVQFHFQMPESLTRWNFMALAHTKDLYYGKMTQKVVTQKEFMISPNLPRFFRHGDKCVLTAKLINLSDQPQKGKAILQLLDPVSEKVFSEKVVDFAINAKENGIASWSFDVPQDLDAVIVRTIAKGELFSDAEQSLKPILSDRMVVTQSLPLIVRGGKTKELTFDNLVKNNSSTLSTKFLKLEFATNPIWYAIQALPSIASVEHENAVSYSAALFATKMAEHIVHSNPKIFNIIQLWKEQGGNKETLLSNLEKNQDVKNILLTESPWVMDAKDETEQKQRLATLFDLNDLQQKSDNWSKKLSEYRTSEGAYSWCKGMYPNRHTTLFVMDNIGRLKKAGIATKEEANQSDIKRTLTYLDFELKKDYDQFIKYHPKKKKEDAYVSMIHLYYFQVRSLFPEVEIPKEVNEAYNFYYDVLKTHCSNLSLQGKALAAITLQRKGDSQLAKELIESLREHSTTQEDLGMYWQKNVSGYFWEDAAISTHTRIMEAFTEVDPNKAEQDELKLWLLNQKRTQNWDNLIANIDALNVLLLSGNNWISTDNNVTIQLGEKTIQPEKKEVGTGYFVEIIDGKDVKPTMGQVKLQSEEGGNISWGALYWQFEEQLNSIVKNKTALHIEKLVMLEENHNGKTVLKTIKDDTQLNVGDKITVRLTLRTSQDLDYVSLKGQRASCLEPVSQTSGYRCSEGSCYYQSPKDAAMYYFFDHLSKGTYVFEYSLWVTHAGSYSNGISTAQCMYAPEFLSNTDGVKIQVKE